MFYIPGYDMGNTTSTVTNLIREFRDRMLEQQAYTENGLHQQIFLSFAEPRQAPQDEEWLADNNKRFLLDTPNYVTAREDYLSELGFISAVTYAPDGDHVMVAYSTGMIQLNAHYRNEGSPDLWYPMFYNKPVQRDSFKWINENYKTFLKDTSNVTLYNRWYFSECGFITALEYSPNGKHIITGHSSGLIQMRHGSTGTVMSTLRNAQFPPKPIYSLQYSKLEDRVCYAACLDGSIYRIEVPNISTSIEAPPEYCIRVDPAMEALNMQFYGAPGFSSHCNPFLTQRYSCLSMGLSADYSKIVGGYSDGSIKVYDIETQEAISTYKVHKLRLQFIPKKLQRNHVGQVCALRCHKEEPRTFISAAWDDTLRFWDTRCKVGCIITFEAPNICADSIDINRDECISGSWSPIEAVSVWDLVARKRKCIVRVQNRRPNIDGEYVYACRYWNSKDHNRKGKYAIIGGSGTQCLEVINLHNRHISCSYPVKGTVVAVTSYKERIAFGGTEPVFNIVTFHDPKHEKYNDSEYQEGDNNSFELDLGIHRNSSELSTRVPI